MVPFTVILVLIDFSWYVDHQTTTNRRHRTTIRAFDVHGIAHWTIHIFTAGGQRLYPNGGRHGLGRDLPGANLERDTVEI